jgi:hypothetical protein
VFEARSMLAMIGDKTEYIDNCELSYNNNRDRSGGNNEKPILSINYNEIAKSIKVYPNPASNSVTIEYSFANTQNGQIEVYNLTGRKIATQILKGNENIIVLQTSTWESGIYTYKIMVDNNIVLIDKLTILK